MNETISAVRSKLVNEIYRPESLQKQQRHVVFRGAKPHKRIVIELCPGGGVGRWDWKDSC